MELETSDGSFPSEVDKMLNLDAWCAEWQIWASKLQSIQELTSLINHYQAEKKKKKKGKEAIKRTLT